MEVGVLSSSSPAADFSTLLLNAVKNLFTTVSPELPSQEDAFAQAEKYGAKFLFSERAAEVTNYYYYSPRLCGGVEIGGALVNLHVAVRGEGASVGSPLIFGGY